MRYTEMKLEDTVALMASEDWKDRVKAEYWQTQIRYERLHKMVVKAEAGTLPFQLNCPLELLKEQKRHMGEYLHCMEIRAEIEGVDLFGACEKEGG